MNRIERILCGLVAILFAPVIVMILSSGVVVVGYTKMSMFIAFICGYNQELCGTIDRDRIAANIEDNRRRLERWERMRQLR